MSGLDIFAWIVLVILLAVIVLVFWLMGSLPGHVARRRAHPGLKPVPRASAAGCDPQLRQSVLSGR
jgi:Protein of unknown function (DUF3302)